MKEKLFICIIFFIIVRCMQSVMLCEYAKRWTFSGRDLVREYRASILFLAFLPLHTCDNFCTAILNCYSNIHNSCNDKYDVLIVVSQATSPQLTRELSSLYPKFRFEQETKTMPIWRWFNATNYDHFIFDRCSRLAEIIDFDQFTTNVEESQFIKMINAHLLITAKKMENIIHNGKCGWCQYDFNTTANYSKFYNNKPLSHKAPSQFKKMNVLTPQTMHYMNKKSSDNVSKNKEHFFFDTPQRLQQFSTSANVSLENVHEMTTFIKSTDKVKAQKKPQPRLPIQIQNMHNQQIFPSPETSTKYTNMQSIKYNNYSHSHRYQHRLNSNAFDKVQRQHIEETKRIAKLRALDEMKRQQQINELHQFRLKQMELLREQERLQQKRNMEQKQRNDNERRRQSKNSGNSGEPAPLYLDQDNYINYYEDEIQEITPLPIVRALPSTYISFYSAPSAEARDYSFNFPCDSYNDDICYQQHIQLKANEIHRCCKNRLLFTDLCRPGKCSNVTQQLCCIQKFLQAKLTCCTDENQLEINAPGDYFNKCCYNHFVTEDDTCCPSAYANDQWRTINELCHPNVDIDLSRVRVSTVLSGTSLTKEFDFSKTDKWNFTCKYGLHVLQYNYNFD